MRIPTPRDLNFGYQYPVGPEGLLPRFIVRTHHLSDPTTRWKSGVILYHPGSGCRALVCAEAAENQVPVHIEGPAAGRCELLAVIRHNFDAIHGDYEFQPAELVYPPGVPERPLVVEEFKALHKSGIATYLVMLPGRSVRTLRIADLVEPVQAAPPPLRPFLSYAHADAKHIEEMRKNLKVMERASWPARLPQVRRYQIDKLPGRDNLRLLPILREVPLVAGHEIIGATGVGALDEDVVVGVLRHLKGAGRFHETCPMHDQIDDLPLNTLADSEFRTCQDVPVLCQNCPGNEQACRFCECHQQNGALQTVRL